MVRSIDLMRALYQRDRAFKIDPPGSSYALMRRADAERTVGPVRMFVESLTSSSGIREQHQAVSADRDTLYILAANYLAFIQLASIRLWLRVNKSASLDWEDSSLKIITQTIMKKYCSLVHSQPVLDAVLDLKRRNGLAASDVEHVRCDIFLTGFDIAPGVGAFGQRTTHGP